MRALAALAALAGVAALLATASGGGRSGLPSRVGWTGYAPVASCPAGAVSYRSYTYTWTKGKIVRQGETQVVCRRSGQALP